ncbi:MAG TPA: DUF2298 domain-containing protein [Ktedonobacteraceae bacterium]|nr:DUF2298 domain-containing protein [Ktedonobacteraceae bacterium]
MLELLQMWALMEVLGLLFLPLTVTVFHNLPDRGWAFSKAIGLAVLAFCVWLPLMTLHFLPFSQMFILGVLLILIALNVLGFLRVRKTVLELVRSNVFYIICIELIFFGMTFLLGWLRSYNPDIRNFEMFMDEGFLSAIMRSPHFPPNDMWYAGQSINYYYYAHYTIAMLAKLLGQVPSVAFNTGICMFFGLTAVNLCGVTSNIVAWARQRRRRLEASSDAQAGSMRPDRVFPSLRGALPYGLLTMLLGLVLGNLAATQTWWQNHGDLPAFAWFNASRVITNTINEFPAFSFLLSCFHAHVLALAFTVVGIALAFNLFLEPNGQGLAAFGRGWHLPLTLGVSALLIGSLYAMNGWDYPTYLALILACLALQQWLAHHSSLNWELALDAFTACAALGALSFFLFAPFYLSFVSPAQGLGLVNPVDRTPLVDELLIYGIFAFILLSFLLASFFRVRFISFRPAFADSTGSPGNGATGRNGSGQQRARTQQRHIVLASSGTLSMAREPGARDDQEFESEPLVAQSVPHQVESEPLSFAGLGWLDIRFTGLLATLLIALLVLVFFKNSQTFVVVGGLAVMGSVLVFYHSKERERAFILLLGAVACALVAFCEIIYLRDVFADQVPRMNTVFKFYFQSWALLSIVGGAGAYFVLESLRPVAKLATSSRYLYRASQILWSLALLAFLLLGAVYPLTSPRQRENDFAQRTNSLDGLTYMRAYDPADYAAINWINSNISGDPVIVEAPGGEYSDYGRIAVFTGLPSIINWEGHEWQWRVNWVKRSDANTTDFFGRVTDINKIYTDTSSQEVLTLLARYNAQYIYVGPLEQASYVGANLQRFQSFMQVVYRKNGVTIYKVR